MSYAHLWSTEDAIHRKGGRDLVLPFLLLCLLLGQLKSPIICRYRRAWMPVPCGRRVARPRGQTALYYLLPFSLPFFSLSVFPFPSVNRPPHMTRRLPSREDRKPKKPRQLPTITYRHIPAPTSHTLVRIPSQTMDRTGYSNTRRPAFSSRRSSGHISRRDNTDFNNNSNNNNNNDSHRTLAMRPRYPDRSKSTMGYDAGLCGSVVFCSPQRPGVTLRQASLSGPSYIDTAFAGLDEMPRRGEVYEMPPLSYGSDVDGTVRGRGSTQTSRPSSRGSELVYGEYEDDEERERRRFLGSELYGYVLAMRLRERLVDVRQVLNLYRDFDQLSGCEFYPFFS